MRNWGKIRLKDVVQKRNGVPMKEEIMAFYHKYEELITYAFWGAAAMLVNIVSYHLTYDLMGIPNTISTIIAWALSVITAFVTNKLWVFKSRGTTFEQTMKELGSFVGFRLLSGVVDLGIMIFAVDMMHWNALLWKIIANVIVILMNYIFSKFIIFKKPAE